MEKIKRNIVIVLFLMLGLILFRQCGTNSKIKKVQKENIELKNKIDSIAVSVKKIEDIVYPMRDEITYEIERMMYQFLIYEDDIDKGKTSLSVIKMKLDEYQKERNEEK